MKNLIKILFFLLTIVIFNACFQSKFDEPKYIEIPTGQVITIKNLQDSIKSTPYKFQQDISVFAVVTMDDKSGNIYKSAYIQDANAGINLRLIASGGLYEGDSIRLNLKNTILSMYRGLYQLDSVNVDKNITKIKTGIKINPIDVNIETINNNYQEYLCKLIKINNIKFADDEIGEVFAPKNETVNRTIVDVNDINLKLILRNSGYANFASEIIPNGKGSIIGILGRYNNDNQLFIRHFEEIKLDKLTLSENFNNFNTNDIINIPNWLNISNNTERKWTAALIDNATKHTACVKSNNLTDQTWLILPQQNITTTATISFSTKFQNNGGANIELLYSTDFNPAGNPKDFNWTKIPANFATDLSQINSGEINLPKGNIYIAFKYSNTIVNNSTIYLYNIYIYNKD